MSLFTTRCEISENIQYNRYYQLGTLMMHGDLYHGSLDVTATRGTSHSEISGVGCLCSSCDRQRGGMLFDESSEPGLVGASHGVDHEAAAKEEERWH